MIITRNVVAQITNYITLVEPVNVGSANLPNGEKAELGQQAAVSNKVIDIQTPDRAEVCLTFPILMMYHTLN